jgi:alpha-mannosidase
MRQILLLGHTHHDVGYTNSPRIIDRMHARIVNEVLDLIDAEPGDGPDAMRWTFEVARPVLNFLARADAAEVERLVRAVAGGRVSVTGGYLNMTQLPSEPEFDAAYDGLAALRERGIPVRTEQHGDVNGIAWGTVAAMRRAGITRLVMALNPDHGRAPFTQPTGFWWEGPDGHRVFAWLSTHYGFGEEWGIVDGDVELAERNILEFVEGLDARDDYPYDIALVHAGNDNRWPTALFLEVVRHWNDRHPELPMRTTTVDEALDLLEQQAAAADIPVVRGEWSDWWSHGHGSTAREVAAYREARSFALTAQASLALAQLRGDGDPALASVLGYRRGPVRLRGHDEVTADLAEVDEQLLLFGEHTWGSWESYSKPHSLFSHSHWNAKAGFAYAAYDHARDLAVEGLFRVVASGPDAGADAPTNGVLVFNPTERHRHEPVTMELAAPGNSVRWGSAVASVPPFGTALLPVPALPRELGEATEIATSTYRARIDPARGGVVSLVDLRDGRELVDGTVGHGLGAVVIERVPADSDHPMITTNPKDFHPDHPGPAFEAQVASGSAAPRVSETDEFVQVTWESSGPTVPSAVTTLRLYHDSDIVDLEVVLTKAEVFEPESIFVAFPFAADDPQFLLETAGAVYAAGSEQLPDTSKDWFSIQHAVGIVGGGTGILWGSVDAPLVQVGGLHTGQWARELRVTGGAVNSWLANNLHFTNFQARQDATGRYRYRFASRPGGVTHESVRLYGRDMLMPLQARSYEGPVRLDGSSGLTIEPADAVLAELRPAAVAGTARLRLRNPGTAAITVTVALDGARATPASLDIPAGGVGEVLLTRD